MTTSERKRLLERFNGNPPTDEVAFRRYEAALRSRVRDDYLEFLRETNGGEGFIGNAYVILWRLEELLEMNKAYQVSEYAPDLFLFGSDGGGEAFAFDTRTGSKPIVAVPFVGMDLKLARSVAPDFKAFLEELFKS